MNVFLWFFPPELTIFLIIGGGLCLIFGLRKVAGSLFMAGILMAIVPPFVGPIVNLLPWWVLLLVTGFFFLAIFRGIASLIIGHSAANHMIGILAADVVRAMLLFPIAVIRLAVRLVVGFIR